jgi:hypothetical protein
MTTAKTYTVLATDSSACLAEHVTAEEALEAHSKAGFKATIFDDSDNDPACMVEMGGALACECHRCDPGHVDPDQDWGGEAELREETRR